MLVIKRLVSMLLCFASAEHTTRHSNGRPLNGPRRTGSFLSAEFRMELNSAVHSAFGGGADVAQRLEAIRSGLGPLWSALAADSQGRVDGRSLRYAAHRYLMRNRHFSIKGLEPVLRSLGASASEVQEASLVSEMAPALVKQHLDSKMTVGYSLEDAASFVLMLEELVTQQTHAMLEDAFGNSRTVDSSELLSLLERYFINWMLADDPEAISMIEENAASREEIMDDWNEISKFLEGAVRSHEFSQMRSNVSRGSWAPLRPTFMIEDAKAIADEVTLSFGQYWNQECERVKSSLAKMEVGRTGRVRIGDFHNTALSGEWRFSESKAYLKVLGALDETSLSSGPGVIIPNYIYGTSNCIITANHYRICCLSPCEDYMSEIEKAIRSPVASADELLAVVSNLTTGLDGNNVIVSAELKAQLYQIASLHHGKISLHGRLFAQWLHYLFPRDCLYPHKAGTVSTMSPAEYGIDFLASNTELSNHAMTYDSVNSNESSSAKEQHNDWMTQWSQDEEVLSAQLQMHAPWLKGVRHDWLWGGVVVAGLLASFYYANSREVFGIDRKAGSSCFSYREKPHLV
eukprot:TRINITY_DN33091_c0_g1_i1.p1 TRINITY_DN33091_c0_g1~~TRINITY_DN33091_c0_g1_i1.p1  ORF type:complete len:574 (+),score=97.94 TRINITY_DN33091_c0_g1_i1:120-1841(+)